jgi:hypothetical protein
VKINIKKSLALGTLIPDIAKEFTKDSSRAALKLVIREFINSGKSPVKGKSFKKYSKDYAKLKGKDAPVDMTVTGNMLNSLVVSQGSNGRSLRIYFRSVIAKYHDVMGAGVNKIIRRLLPTNAGERFKAAITKLIKALVNNSVDKAVKKQNN